MITMDFVFHCCIKGRRSACLMTSFDGYQISFLRRLSLLRTIRWESIMPGPEGQLSSRMLLCNYMNSLRSASDRSSIGDPRHTYGLNHVTMVRKSEHIEYRNGIKYCFIIMTVFLLSQPVQEWVKKQTSG